MGSSGRVPSLSTQCSRSAAGACHSGASQGSGHAALQCGVLWLVQLMETAPSSELLILVVHKLGIMKSCFCPSCGDRIDCLLVMEL